MVYEEIILSQNRHWRGEKSIKRSDTAADNVN